MTLSSWDINFRLGNCKVISNWQNGGFSKKSKHSLILILLFFSPNINILMVC